MAKDLAGIDPTAEVTSTAISYVITDPLSAVSLTPNLASPRPALTTIVLTGTATGGANLAYKFLVGSQVLRDYNTVNTCNWKPDTAGTYVLSVAVKDLNGADPNKEISSGSVSYDITTLQLASVSLTVNPASPQVATKTVRLTAATVGGVNIRYKFLMNNGSGWTTLQDYQAANYCDWTPALAGTYSLKVWARESTSANDPDVTSSVMSYRIIALSSQRVLPAGYAAGSPVSVKINITPPAGTQNYAVEDTPPVGWSVSTIDNEGVFDSQTGRVKWGPYYDAQTRTLTYIVTPPTTATGTVTFSGVLSLDGGTEPIGGDTVLAPGSFHPADLNNNWGLSISEVTAYGAAWKSGQTWARNPNPIPISYVTNAGFLWKKGETYHFDSTLNPPYASGAAQASSPVMAQLPLMSSSPASKQSGVLPSSCSAIAKCSVSHYQPGVPFRMTITVAPTANTSTYAVEEHIPAGWAVTSISENGRFDAATGTIRWGVFFDAKPRMLSYVITLVKATSRVLALSGTASVDGRNIAVSGTRSLQIVSR